MKNYTFDSKSNLWHKPGFDGIDYSDGQEIEQRLLDIMTEASDCSVLSEELQAQITDWPTEYHLSRLRHCLLRPLGIQAGDSVLELGCGCGALTRYLGETGADVVSVEGGSQRARITAERCKDLDNVHVVLDNLVSFATEKRFDWVLLIGVLEYAPLFAGTENPVQSYLESASSFLVKDGKLVIAIENQLGLKYFNGCGEDHCGIPYFGINDLYTDKTPVTYGKNELERIVRNAGLDALDFYYPYPDYKLPNTVIHSSAFEEESVQVSDLLLRSQSRDYSGNNYRLFTEQFVSNVLERNNILQDFSNSFLLVAAKKQTSLPSVINDFVWFYSCGSRCTPACMQTIFTRDRDGCIQVNKKRMDEAIDGEVVFDETLHLSQKCGSELFHSGRMLIGKILKGLMVAKSNEEVGELFLPWFHHVIKYASPLEGSDSSKLVNWYISGDCIDAVPFNCIRSDEGQFVFFDQEWSLEKNIPLGWLLLRGIVWSLCTPIIGLLARHGMHPRSDTTLQAIMEHICKQSDLVLDESDIALWRTEELRIQKLITGAEDVRIPLQFKTPQNVFTRVAMLEEKIRRLEEGRVENTLLVRVKKRIFRYLSFFSSKRA